LCLSLLPTRRNQPTSIHPNLLKVYPGFPGNATVLEQCLAEQRYVRGAQLRSLLYSQVGAGPRLRLAYQRVAANACARACAAPLWHGPAQPRSSPRSELSASGALMLFSARLVAPLPLACLTGPQVSISGQALVFVTRCVGHSFLDRAGGLTYLAFFGAQVCDGPSGVCGGHPTLQLILTQPLQLCSLRASHPLDGECASHPANARPLLMHARRQPRPAGCLVSHCRIWLRRLLQAAQRN
jgi:hypothetical protein